MKPIWLECQFNDVANKNVSFFRVDNNYKENCKHEYISVFDSMINIYASERDFARKA